jgi:Type II secretion system protein C
MSTSAETSRVARMEAWHVPSWLTPSVAKTALWSLIFAWTAWLASQWIREALAPSAPTYVSAPRAKLDLDSAINRAAGAPLFGEMSPSDVPKALRPSTYAIKLKGVIAGGSDGPMVAIVNTGGAQDELVQLHMELSPGVLLKGIYPTHVVISRNGVEERVELEALRSDDSRAAATATASKAPGSHRQEAPPARQAPAAEGATAGQPAPAGAQPESRPAPGIESGPNEREPAPPAPGTQPKPDSLGMPAGAGTMTHLAARAVEHLDVTAALFTEHRAQSPG